MNIADRNRLILGTINTRGFVRIERRKAMTFNAIAEATGIEADLLRETLAALCEPSQFSPASLLHLPGDIYAQPVVMVGFDYHQVRELADGRFHVLRGGKTISSHDGVDAAADAALKADHDHVYGHRVACRPVDATFHDCGRNSDGEAFCLPDR